MHFTHFLQKTFFLFVSSSSINNYDIKVLLLEIIKSTSSYSDGVSILLFSIDFDIYFAAVHLQLSQCTRTPGVRPNNACPITMFCEPSCHFGSYSSLATSLNTQHKHYILLARLEK